MIDALISGRVYGKPEQRTSKTGSTFVRVKIRVPTSDGQAMFASAVCFSDSLSAQLLALDDGDTVALAGALSVRPWLTNSGEPAANLDMVVHAATTAYHVSRKREAMHAPKQEKPTKQQTAAHISAMAPPQAFADIPEDPL